MPDGLRLALTTLTVLPVRGPKQLDRRGAGQAMTLAPGVGLLLGLLAAGVLEGLRALTAGPPLLAAAAAVAVLAALTRGLHLDGLGDLADGLGCYASPEQARAVMKAPDIGALGLATVVLVLLAQVGALLACVAAGRGAASLVLATVVARLAVTAACTPTTPAAVGTGLGALVAGTVRPGVPAAGAALVAATAAGCAALSAGTGDGTGAEVLLRAAQAAAAVVLGLLAARSLRRHAVRRLGGLTGDVLGALVEATTTVVLVVMALEPP